MTLITREGLVTITSPNRLLNRLCKHFSHRVQVEYHKFSARVTFAEGSCHLQANADQLRIVCSADSPDNLEAIVSTLNRHVPQFCAPDTAWVNWKAISG